VDGWAAPAVVAVDPLPPPLLHPAAHRVRSTTVRAMAARRTGTSLSWGSLPAP
jgi:hypothetical protein